MIKCEFEMLKKWQSKNCILSEHKKGLEFIFCVVETWKEIKFVRNDVTEKFAQKKGNNDGKSMNIKKNIIQLKT